MIIFPRAATAFAAVLAAGAALAGAAPAFAQDSNGTDGLDRASHFDGVYVSGTFGVSAQENDRGDTLVFDTNRDGTFSEDVNTSAGANAFSTGFCNGIARNNVPDGGCRGDRDKFEYGGRIGFDSRMGNIVVGALIEASKSKARDGTSGFSTTPASYSISRELDYAGSLRARVGFTPNGGALFYATGGASYARINHDFSTTNTANSFTANRDKKMVWGWQAGGGAEVMLGNNVSIGLEYLYNRYKDDKYFVAVGQGTAPATNPFLLNGGGTNLRPSDKRFEFHSLRATLSFQL